MQRCREDEERRTEMASHFQAKLTDIQAQIEQHSARNDKLCRENANLTDKLEQLVNQCEVRDEVRGGRDERACGRSQDDGVHVRGGLMAAALNSDPLSPSGRRQPASRCVCRAWRRSTGITSSS